MCNQHIDPNNPFADISEDEFEKELQRDIKAPVSEHTESIGNIEVPGFVENCPKCGGSGSWRPGYKCFKCKGTGKLSFKTAPEARAKARKYSQKRKVKSQAENVESFKTQFPAEAHWIISNDHNEFASSLRQGVEKYGSLTDGQLAAVRKAIARDDDKKIGFAEWCKQFDGVLDWLTSESDNGNEFAGSLLTAGLRYGTLTENQLAAVQKNLGKDSDAPETDIDLSSLVKGYYAVPEGDTRLKIAIRRPGKNSRWYGWTFVDDGAQYGSRKTYGKQAPDGLYKGSLTAQLQQIIDNPLDAMVAYGKLTGTCGKCGRILEDEASVAAGIGPVCASKM